MTAPTPGTEYARGLAGVVAGRTGITLGTRLQSLNTWKGHPNCIEPGKRPRITLTPGLVFRDGKPVHLETAGLRVVTIKPDLRTELMAGKRTAAKMPMMAMTVRSSMSVKPERVRGRIGVKEVDCGEQKSTPALSD